jgi:hypothetical protein
MAAPPEDLRAHDRGSATPCECQKLEKAGGKLFTDQMVGVTAECRVPPGSVGSIRDGSAAASQVRKPDDVLFQTRVMLGNALRAAAGTASFAAL